MTHTDIIGGVGNVFTLDSLHCWKLVPFAVNSLAPQSLVDLTTTKNSSHYNNHDTQHKAQYYTVTRTHLFVSKAQTRDHVHIQYVLYEWITRVSTHAL